MLLGGVACQPFSRLGDQRAELDPRSESFPALLRMGYLLGSLAIVVECTVGASESAWVQSLLQQFTEATKYSQHQHVFHLHKSWPARRERWWTVLAHPAMFLTQVPDMPSHRFEPGLLHLISGVLELPENELSQLRLSPKELCGFHAARGGVRSNLLDLLRAMPTATHSWGSQLVGCECECRSDGFSEIRLKERGLYGALVTLQTHTSIGGDQVQDLRHLHPIEVALANGMNPQILTQEPRFALRLELAGVGQLASPLQGVWVMSNILFQAAQQDLIQCEVNPRHVFAQVCRDLLQVRDHIWPSQPDSKYMQIFAREIEAVDRPIVFFDQEDQDEDSLTQEIALAVQELEQRLVHDSTKVPEVTKVDDLFDMEAETPFPDSTKVPMIAVSEQSVSGFPGRQHEDFSPVQFAHAFVGPNPMRHVTALGTNVHAMPVGAPRPPGPSMSVPLFTQTQ